MKKTVKGFTRNYDGEAIKPGEVMIPFEYTELDAESCSNPECIKTVKQAGRNFKVIYKAVPEEWEKDAKAAFNLVQNEALGHYNVSNSVSMDAMRDEFELEMSKAPSAEDVVMEKEDLDEALNGFVEMMETYIKKSAKIGYAVLLRYAGIKGEDFYFKMKLSHNPANKLQQQADSILKTGLAKFDVDHIKFYKSQYENEYCTEAYKLLDKIVKMYR